jgi:hypothetical protein
VSYEPDTPFDSIEGAEQYLTLLVEAIEEAKQDIEAEILLLAAPEMDRRKQALHLVSYNLAKLSVHMATSRRILNDLRMLRRVLTGTAVEAASSQA